MCKDIHKGFKAMKVKISMTYNLADEILDCGSENLRQVLPYKLGVVCIKR